MANKLIDLNGLTTYNDKVKAKFTATEALIAAKSTVSVSASGSATDEVKYITVDGTEKKLAGSDINLENGTGLDSILQTGANVDTHAGELNTANGISAAALGGCVQATGAFSQAFGRSSKALQYGCATLGGANTAGRTLTEFNTWVKSYTDKGTTTGTITSYKVDNITYCYDSSLPTKTQYYLLYDGFGTKHYGYDRYEVYALVAGERSYAKARGSVSIGEANITNSEYAAAIGGSANVVNGFSSFATGSGNTVNAAVSCATGLTNIINATANNSFATGSGNTTSGAISFVAGSNNNITATNGTAFGDHNTVNGTNGAVFGVCNTAYSNNTFAQGENVVAFEMDAAAFGRYNNYDKSGLLLSVGNGSNSARSNAFEVFEDGHAEVGSTGYTPNSVANRNYVDTERNRAIAAENALNAKIQNKTNAYVISTNDVVELSSYIRYKDEDGNIFSTNTQLSNYIQGLASINSEFVSTNDNIVIDFTGRYLIVREDYNNEQGFQYKKIIKSANKFKLADDIYIVEENYLDRWIGNIAYTNILVFYAYNAKADLSSKSNATNLENGTGEKSVQMKDSQANGKYSTALGKGKSYGYYSLSNGSGAEAGLTEAEFNTRYPGGVDEDGNNYANYRAYCLASGLSAKAKGKNSTAFGNVSEAIGMNSFAVNGSKANAKNSFGIGEGNIINSSAEGGISIGSDNIVNHPRTTALGLHLQSGNNNQILLGQYNIGQNNTILEIGDGNNQARSNLLEVGISEGSKFVNIKGNIHHSEGTIITPREVVSEAYIGTGNITNTNSSILVVNGTGSEDTSYYKAYINSPMKVVRQLEAGRIVGNSKGWMTQLQIQDAPVNNDDVATKQYVDNNSHITADDFIIG